MGDKMAIILHYSDGTVIEPNHGSMVVDDNGHIYDMKAMTPDKKEELDIIDELPDVDV